ncbi:hypothetical protein YC2023_058250 [Brassica napus]
MMGRAAAIVAKSAAAPIKRVKLLLQNQGKLIKTGHLTRPYTNLGNCFVRIFREEGVLSFWRGNQANVIRYFPRQLFLGWSITTSAGVIAYPFDTVRRGMMLTSRQPVKYRNAIHALRDNEV